MAPFLKEGMFAIKASFEGELGTWVPVVSQKSDSIMILLHGLNRLLVVFIVEDRPRAWTVCSTN